MKVALSLLVLAAEPDERRRLAGAVWIIRTTRVLSRLWGCGAAGQRGSGAAGQREVRNSTRSNRTCLRQKNEPTMRQR